MKFIVNLFEGFNNILSLGVGDYGIHRKRKLVFMHVICLGEIRDVKAFVFIGCKQRQRLEVNVAHYAVFSHFVVKFVSEVGILAVEADKVKVTAAAVILVSVIKNLNVQIFEFLIVVADKSVAPVEHFIIAVELGKADCRQNVGHIALILGIYNVVFP